MRSMVKVAELALRFVDTLARFHMRTEHKSPPKTGPCYPWADLSGPPTVPMGDR